MSMTWDDGYHAYDPTEPWEYTDSDGHYYQNGYMIY